MLPLLIPVAFGVGYLVGKKRRIAPNAPKSHTPNGPENDLSEAESAEIIDQMERDKAFLIRSELEQMRYEIMASEKSSSVLIFKKDSYDVSHRAYTPSTFPKWFSELGFKSTKDFLNICDKGLAGQLKRKSVRWERLRQEAEERLTRGYSNAHGYNPPHPLFEELPF